MGLVKVLRDSRQHLGTLGVYWGVSSQHWKALGGW